MDYATNPHHSKLHSQLMLWLSQPTLVKHCTKWLLLDASLIEQNEFIRLMKSHKYISFHNVFSKSRFEVYGLYAPHLIRLDDAQTTTQAEFLKDLLNLSSGIPALAALDACDDITSLRECLTWFAQAFTPDSLELYCRLADTRITPGLVQVLDDEQKIKLEQCILQWQVINRLGALEALLPNIKPLPDDKTPFKKFASIKSFTLADAQYKTLMVKAEPDEIFQMLFESNSDLVPDKDRGLFHQRLSANSERAHQHGLENSADLFLFALVALTTNDQFDRHPVLEETWRSIKQNGTSFNKLVKAWPDKIWQDLAPSAIN